MKKLRTENAQPTARIGSATDHFLHQLRGGNSQQLISSKSDKGNHAYQKRVTHRGSSQGLNKFGSVFSVICKGNEQFLFMVSPLKLEDCGYSMALAN